METGLGSEIVLRLLSRCCVLRARDCSAVHTMPHLPLPVTATHRPCTAIFSAQEQSDAQSQPRGTQFSSRRYVMSIYNSLDYLVLHATLPIESKGHGL
jgi:hypothetical protein